MTLEEEAEGATKLLAGRVVETIWRHRPREIVIQFTDGSRLFVDINDAALELSVTNCNGE
ncbi:hypothetical protein [Pseudoxanthomonas sp.]|uniref:hypothetical protein n=1 Tax=Pseudoxanthomonas sp. TaxID=1871049 RepID=UPI0026222CA3|nr:hypothetical protein [Pseudoxanthomonas sp.]WDS37334.1 MAG: hypothetical protein O8I58_05480 [Pseudoxanthomonas sp.]